MQRFALILPVFVVLGVVMLTTAASRTPTKPVPPPVDAAELTEIRKVVAIIDQELADQWEREEVSPAEPADDLTVLRRLSLALHGTIPSLEEIRQFEADTRPDRLDHWTQAMLEDSRFNDYFAERLARGYVGVEQGQFLIFRRDRFLDWLTRQLRDHVPYDEMVRQMIAGEGVWTGNGEVNFVTSGFANDNFDANKLTARTTRAFLGQRIDCAQCHDHPFDHWKQEEFEGLAAHFGQVQLSLAGVVDKPDMEFVVQDRVTLEDRTVDAQLPFNEEWTGQAEHRRQRLANWVTHPENRRFERALANRLWGLLCGKPYVQHRPVDDLPDPDEDGPLTVLDLLGQDFREHHCDLRWLIRVITGTKVFRMESIHPLEMELRQDLATEQLDELSAELTRTKENWGLFPLIRLRPEQVIGAMLQANNLHTIDQNSHLFTRAIRFFREQDFVKAFGDPGVNELEDRAGTIPQALLRMNGEFADELTKLTPFSAPGRINGVAKTPDELLETCYLTCLSRRPTEDERAHFLPIIEAENREQVVQDIYWILFNAPEFSWNH